MVRHDDVKDRLQEIDRIVIETQEPAVRIIDKTGPLDNPADRDHCLQYMTAVPLVLGRLTAADYEDTIARDPRIDVLRARMEVRENEDFTRDYYDPQKRYIGNAIQVYFSDGTSTRRVQVDYPVGHRLRRAEGIPLLRKKFAASISPKVKQSQWQVLDQLCEDREQLKAMPVDDFLALLVA